MVSQNNKFDDRKIYQLCTQAQRALTYAFGELDSLSHLLVSEVQPYPNASKLLVLVIPSDQRHVQRAEVLEKLDEFKGVLRTKVAQSINRKRAPELVFELALLAPQEEDSWV